MVVTKQAFISSTKRSEDFNQFKVHQKHQLVRSRWCKRLLLSSARDNIYFENASRHFWLLRNLWVIDPNYVNSYLGGDICSESEVVIIDAKTMAPEPVAVVKLPQRVPYGFHALFMSEVCKLLKTPSLVLISTGIHSHWSHVKIAAYLVKLYS